MGITDLHRNLQRQQVEKTDAQRAGEAAAHVFQICSRFIMKTRGELRVLQRLITEIPGSRNAILQAFQEPERSEIIEILNKMKAIANEHRPEGSPILVEDQVAKNPDHPLRR